MAISRFKSLQRVLSETRDTICRVTGVNRDDVFSKTEEFIAANSEQWRQPQPHINYGNPFCRMAYLYMNVAVHANLVEQALSMYPELGDLIRIHAETGMELGVCALGGGPGSELLGLVRFIESFGPLSGTVHLDVALVDRTKEWDESWHCLKDGVEEQLRYVYGSRLSWPVSISRSFLTLDAINVEDYANFPTRFSKTKLFIVCYLASELKGSLDYFEQVIDLLAQRSEAGSYWLFIDRDEKAVREAVEGIIHRNRSLSDLGTVHRRGAMEDDPAELGDWYINIEAIPRNRWLAFFTMARKD